MPTYDYRIEETGDIIEVTHTVALTPKNWEELCLLANIDPQGIPAKSLVTKLLAVTGMVKTSPKIKAKDLPCMSGKDCPSGGCS
ncbi:regulator [Neptuniibacter marinus]|uniref:regulator n=1 Tax=Neptuniibacter marinus TaxID=1806670 RepID=UPI00083568D4|nr:regulator [Neptuniibacter marinus]